MPFSTYFPSFSYFHFILFVFYYWLLHILFDYFFISYYVIKKSFFLQKQKFFLSLFLLHHCRLKDEWGFAALNVLSMSICNAAIVWSLAPCRSYGSTFKFNLQNTIQKLPNNIFERSYAFREFDAIKRAQSFFYKAGELCLVGLITGAASGSLMKLLASQKERLEAVVLTTNSSKPRYTRNY